MRVTLLWTFIFSLSILIALPGNTYAQVVINEVMSSNGITLHDEDGDYEDWIELYNTGYEPVSLHSYGLSDRSNQPFHWVEAVLCSRVHGFTISGFSTGQDLTTS